MDGTLPFVPVAVAFSPDGRAFAAAGERGVVVHDLERQAARLTVLDAHARPITGVAWSADGAWIATSSVDHTVRVWTAT